MGSVVRPHSFPKIVRDFWAIMGNEIKVQSKVRFNQHPNYIVASVGDGSMRWAYLQHF